MAGRAAGNLKAEAGARLGRRLALACLALSGIAATVGIGILASDWYRPPDPDTADTVRLAYREYIAGHFDVAKRLTKGLELDPEEQPDLYQTGQFLIGAAGVRLAAEEADAQQMRRETAAAVPHLEWGNQHGFPPGRTAEGQQLLASGLLTLGRFAEAVPLLRAAIAKDPTLARELLLPLAEANLRAPSIDTTEALPNIDRLLDLPNLSVEVREKAGLLRARVLTALERWPEARTALQAVADPELRDAVDQATAELLIAEAQSLQYPAAANGAGPAAPPPEALKLLDEAIAILEKLDRRGDAGRAAEARYLAGRAHRIAGRRREALELFSALRQSRKEAAEAIAAGIEEAELLSEMGQFAEILPVVQAIVHEVDHPVAFETKWFPLPVLKNRLAAVAGQLRSAGAYAESIEFASALPPVFEPSESLRIEAAGHHAWGQSMLDQFADAAGEEASVARSDAREHLRIAGDAYATAAELHFVEPNYVDFLWDAIVSYQAGREFSRSLELLDDYLRYEARERKARGLLAQARALLAIAEPERAIRPLEQCVVEFPRDPLRYEARLLAAVGHLELGEVDEARRMLEENLFDGLLAPSSPVYRDSLFILGESLFRQAHREHLQLTTPTLPAPRLQPGDQPSEEIAARFGSNQQLLEDTILRLDQAAHRDRTHGNATRSRRATYLTAEAHMLASFWPSIVAADPETLESARRQLNQKRAAHLAAAQQKFAELREQLSGINQQDELQGWEPAMLRNCFLAEADALFEIGDLAAAATAYQNVSQRFMNEPLSLEALLRQMQCFEEMGREADARRVLQHASRVLQRIPPEADLRFAETTRYDRARWKTLLEWLEQT